MTTYKNSNASLQPSSLVVGDIYRTLNGGETSNGRIESGSILFFVGAKFVKRSGMYELTFIHDTKKIVICCFNVTFLEKLFKEEEQT